MAKTFPSLNSTDSARVDTLEQKAKVTGLQESEKEELKLLLEAARRVR